MELLQGTEMAAAVAVLELAARTARLQLEHLKADQQQDAAHFRLHPLPEELR
jgi:hypothetical protein